MNTRQIMESIRGLRANALGVYAADKIPRVLSSPAAIVSNLDTADKPGSHWIAIYIDKNGYGNYFDSYGLAPLSAHHLDCLRRNCARYRWSEKQLQSFDSKVCGEYCIVFLYYMCIGGNLRSFHSLFGSRTRDNDILVTRFHKKLKKYLKRNRFPPVRQTYPRGNYRGSGFCDQTCESRMNFSRQNSTSCV